MKDVVRASVVQFAPTWLDPSGNAVRMAEIARTECADGAELVVFPELSNTGYIEPFHGFDIEFARRYVAAAEPVPGPTTDALAEVARAHRAHIVVGVNERHPTLRGVLWNSAVLIGPDGQVMGRHRKVHIPAGEKHYFTPGDEFGVFDTELGKIGLTVCYDGRFPESTRELALKGAEIVCGIWARFGVEGLLSGEGNHHAAFVRAQENALFYLFCNRAGSEADKVFLGHSAIGAPNGELLAASRVEEEEIIRAELRASRIEDARLFLSIYRDRRPDAYRSITAPLGGAMG